MYIDRQLYSYVLGGMHLIWTSWK